MNQDEIMALTVAERLTSVQAWATETLAALPAIELDSKIEVHRVGAEFPAWKTCRETLESMRDYPQTVYELCSYREPNTVLHPNASHPLIVSQWLQYPGLFCV